LNKNGSYSLGTPENMLKVDWDNIISIEKFNEKTTLSAIYFDGESKNYYVKRFAIEVKTELK
jgi:topoisomerase-4 subunit A